MATDTRPRGVTLRILDADTVARQVGEQTGGYKPRPSYRYAVAEKGRTLYVVCSEGVGWKVTDADPLVLDLGVTSARLSPAEVRQHMTAEAVDLADLVRTFGARLEGNFHGWHRRLS